MKQLKAFVMHIATQATQKGSETMHQGSEHKHEGTEPQK
jgi:hypothetical protein